MTGILSLLIAVQIGKLQELIPGSQYAKPVFLTLLLSIACHFFARPTPSPWHKTWRRPLVYWFLLTLAFIASVPMSLWPSNSIQFLVPRHLATSILMLLAAVHLNNMAKLEKTTLALLWCVFILGIAIIVRPTAISDADGRIRTTVGETYDPNDLAMAVVMIVPFMVYWFWRRGTGTKLLSIVCCLLAAAVVIRTGSRGGMLAFGIVMFYQIVAVKEIGMLLRAVLAAGILVGAGLATQTSTFKLLVLALQGKDYNTTSEEGRLEIWKRGVTYMIRNPLTGVGVDCFVVAEGTLAGRRETGKKRWSAAHNSFVQVAAETGVPGLLFWTMMIVSTFGELKRQRRLLAPWRDDLEIQRILMMGSMVRCSLIAFIIGGFFLSMAYFVLLYLLVGYTCALGNIANAAAGELEEELCETPDGDVHL